MRKLNSGMVSWTVLCYFFYRKSNEIYQSYQVLKPATIGSNDHVNNTAIRMKLSKSGVKGVQN